MTRHATIAIPLGLLLAGCATASFEHATPRPPQAIPTLEGSYYRVRRGETLWRIAKSFGLEVNTLANANHLPSASALKAGQQLFIPLPPESNRFVWPVRGTPISPRSSKELLIRSQGDLVRASRSGQVAVATRRLSGVGNTVILDHFDGYLTVYAGLANILVTPGMRVRQGTPIGNLEGDPLYFEIRSGAVVKNAWPMLPRLD